jgi:hypothetical protein
METGPAADTTLGALLVNCRTTYTILTCLLLLLLRATHSIMIIIIYVKKEKEQVATKSLYSVGDHYSIAQRQPPPLLLGCCYFHLPYVTMLHSVSLSRDGQFGESEGCKTPV